MKKWWRTLNPEQQAQVVLGAVSVTVAFATLAREIVEHRQAVRDAKKNHFVLDGRVVHTDEVLEEMSEQFASSPKMEDFITFRYRNIETGEITRKAHTHDEISEGLRQAGKPYDKPWNVLGMTLSEFRANLQNPNYVWEI